MYVKFIYDSGYCGGEFEEIVEFPDDMDEIEIECEFEIWYENQKRDNGYWEILSEEEVEDYEDC